MKKRIMLMVVALIVGGCSGASDETIMVGGDGPPQPEQATPVAARTGVGSTISERAEEADDVATTSAADEESSTAAPIGESIQPLAPVCIGLACRAYCRTISFRPNTCYAGGHCVGGFLGAGSTCKCWKYADGSGIRC